jgi:hypothetical protein
MCAHYESAIKPERLKLHFDVSDLPPGLKTDLWPGYHGPLIRKHEFAGEDLCDDAVPFRESMVGAFGLIPHRSKDATIARRTYNGVVGVTSVTTSRLRCDFGLN